MRPSFSTLLGGALCLGLAYMVWTSANHLEYLHLRKEAAPWMALWGALAVALALLSARCGARPLVPVALWVGVSVASTLWSESPAATLTASLWHFLYLAAFALGWRWPRPYLVTFGLVNVVIIAAGVDTLLVTSGDVLTGVWFEKNVQGAQFVLWLPALAVWALGEHKYAPLLALLLGASLALLALTPSASSQLLVLAGLALVALLGRARLRGRGQSVDILGVVVLTVVGAGLIGFMVRPGGATVANLGVGEAGPRAAEEVSTSLTGRLYMLQDVGRRAFETLPFGTGAGTLRNIYASLQTHPEIKAVDAHNYYLQTLLELGLPGLALLLWLFAAALLAAWRNRHLGVLVSLFLYMAYLAFSVPAYYPALMLLFFGLLGSAHPPREEGSSVTPSPLRWAVLGLLVVPFAWAWWSAPCERLDCASGRRLAARDTVEKVAATLPLEKRLVLTEEAKRKNPYSLFAYSLYADAYAQTGDARGTLALRRDLAERFPASHAQRYLDWCEAALAAGDPAEARRAFQASRVYFTPDFKPVNPTPEPLYLTGVCE